MIYTCRMGQSPQARIDPMIETISYFLGYYRREVVRFWDHLGPHEYASILIVVGIIGWLAMKSNLKR